MMGECRNCKHWIPSQAFQGEGDCYHLPEIIFCGSGVMKVKTEAHVSCSGHMPKDVRNKDLFDKLVDVCRYKDTLGYVELARKLDIFFDDYFKEEISKPVKVVAEFDKETGEALVKALKGQTPFPSGGFSASAIRTEGDKE